MSEIPKLYDPAAAQAKWFSFWEQHGYFNADPNPNKPSHTIMIPLPNVTGALHMGHALNSTCQDLINRWRRMQGYEALWMPGTDHAGIATQAVVERRMLEEEGLTRHDVGREALVNRIWRWKDAYEKRIIAQLKSMGDSCDWRRVRFTLDEVCARAVRRTFFKMFKDGLIYRGKRLVNWDVHLQTAVADDEVFEEDVAGHFWTFNYPVVDDTGKPTGESIRFSTTRPETMLGDTAVCVHPTDERYTALVGKQVKIPVSGRLIPIIADALLADKELGTGAVKVTPAHDPNDYACYMRNPEIGIINILNSDGTLNEYGGEWQGIDRLVVRPQIVERMGELGHFEAVEDRIIPLKHSDRSKTPVEPFLSDQWFVKMDTLAQNAIDAVEDGRVRFYPQRYAKTYIDWLSEKRDWCISRQLWWGHRIPVWTLSEENEIQNRAADSLWREILTRLITDGRAVAFVGKAPLQVYSGTWSFEVIEDDSEKNILRVCFRDDVEETEVFENAGFVQDPDVLDTWFSSALWPHATLGWPDTEHNPPLDEKEVAKQTAIAKSEPGALATGAPGAHASGSDSSHSTLNAQHSTSHNEVLDYFYPGSVLITSRDIITLWVARMVLTGLYNMGDVPFKHVHVHPKILDGFGQTMSKSKGNGVDPVDLINKYGTDAVRFTIASFAGETQDVKLPISYECPKCETLIPQTLKHQSAKPEGGPKPTIHCPKCKANYQYTSPNYDPDPDAPVARMVSERFEYGRNFCNKFWNAARFAMMNLADYTPGEVTADQLQLEDRWILSRLSTTANAMNEYLGRYQFDAATRAVRDFTWNEFCDWYLEMVKPRLRQGTGERGQGTEYSASERATAQRVLLCVLDSLVRLLQPFAPFICEELWQRLAEIAPVRALPTEPEASAPGAPVAHAQGSVVLTPSSVPNAAIIAQWPQIPTAWQDPALEKRFERLQETIAAVRNVRAIYNIPPGTPVKLLMRAAPDVAGDMQSVSAQFDNLAKAVLEAAGAEVQRPTGSASFTLGDADGFIPLAGLIDTKAELQRQQKEAEKIRKAIAGSEARLSNDGFLSKAKEEVVTAMRDTLEGYKKQLKSIEDIIDDLS
ncbi:valine--tRNA ligase [Planctomicrobium piriforme]|uniref:Valine--tRNA ligase n=1 Tax=Planctomicrobium piriforme TaxID=1576369 RepID=A0A1I3K3V2_9PLAN|nr:valine--tRNA ligase [Planctomicrobium piriforme]SFI66885.1 valyl-tRNA synthetase [Planctomicrobium piriforme]